MNWKDLFSSKILERGYDYYIDDAVIEFSETENHIRAVVEGSDYYTVGINKTNDEIKDMDCSCPYANDGNNCKHMAAALFRWEYSDEEESSCEYNASELVKNADRKSVEDFLIRVLNNNAELYAEFKILVTNTVSNDDVKGYKQIVNGIIRKYSDYGFIDYRAAKGFADELEDFIHNYIRIMIDKNCLHEAFEMTNYIFISINNVDIDDSDGELGMLADSCQEIWEEMANGASIDFKQYMYEHFINILSGSVIDYFEDYIEDFLLNNFTEKEFTEKKLSYVEAKIKAAEKNKSENRYYSNYSLGKWYLKCIELHKQLGKDWAFVESYCKNHWSNSYIRSYYIEICIKNAEYDKAISALKESIDMDNNYPGLIFEYRLKLKDIYNKLSMQEDYLEILWDIVLDNSNDLLAYYRELKGQYTDSEWQDKREIVFSALEKSYRIGDLYKEEELFDRLLDYVINSYSISDLKKYTKDLKEKYHKELLLKYGQILERMAEPTTNRRTYAEIADILKFVLKIKGGSAFVKEIIERWQKVYSRRKAMMEELKKVYD